MTVRTPLQNGLHSGQYPWLGTVSDKALVYSTPIFYHLQCSNSHWLDTKPFFFSFTLFFIHVGFTHAGTHAHTSFYYNFSTFSLPQKLSILTTAKKWKNEYFLIHHSSLFLSLAHNFISPSSRALVDIVTEFNCHPALIIAELSCSLHIINDWATPYERPWQMYF